MTEVVVIAKASALAGREDEMERALRENAEASRQEPACLSYSVLRSASGVFVTVERWKSKEDVDAHMKTPHVERLFAALAPLLGSPPDIDVYQEV